MKTADGFTMCELHYEGTAVSKATAGKWVLCAAQALTEFTNHTHGLQSKHQLASIPLCLLSGSKP